MSYCRAARALNMKPAPLEEGGTSQPIVSLVLPVPHSSALTQSPGEHGSSSVTPACGIPLIASGIISAAGGRALNEGSEQGVGGVQAVPRVTAAHVSGDR